MVRKQWLGLIAVLVGLSGCGSDSVTKPPPTTPRPDAAVVEGDAGDPSRPDTGVVAPVGDAGYVVDEFRVLNVLGDTEPSVQYGDSIELTALLVGSGLGAVPNEEVTFTLQSSGTGTLAATSATTDAAGVVRMVFSATKVAGSAMVTATSTKVKEGSEASWVIRTVAPVRTLTRASSATLQIDPAKSEKASVKLTEKNLPLAGGKITFKVVGGTRGTVLLNGKSADSDLVVTGLDGMARVTLTVPTVKTKHFFTLEAREEYSVPVTFTVNVAPLEDIYCSTNAECRTGEICNTSSGKCEPKPECVTVDDCNKGFSCEQGRCVAVAAACTSQAQCVAGTYCDLGLGKCVRGCASNADCVSSAPRTACDPTTHACVYPTQVLCSTDAECPTNYRCDGVRCVPKGSSGKNCATSADCPSGEYCNTNLGQCVLGCEVDMQCPPTTPKCEEHQCVTTGCQGDTECFPGVCDLVSGKCVDAPAAILDVNAPLGQEWNAVQIFHVKGLMPADVQSKLAGIDTALQAVMKVVDCHVSELIRDYNSTFASILDFLGLSSAIDQAVCSAVTSYVPDWFKTVVHIGADVSKIINDFEVHSKMLMQQPGDGETDKAKVSGVDTWETAYFYWYTNSCPSPGAGQPPPQCALVEIDLNTANIRPTPSTFTGRVDGTTLVINTHQINIKFGDMVRVLIEKLLQWQTGYQTIEDAINAAIDCSAVSQWVKNVVLSILPDQWDNLADAIDLTSTCQSALSAAASTVVSKINDLNSNIPMSLNGKAGIVQLPGNTSNVADKLMPGIWYGKFNNQGDQSKAFGEWYADRP